MTTRVAPEGHADTDLYARPSLNRQQLRYLLALLETRTARQQLSPHARPGEHSEIIAGAMRRLIAIEQELSALYHAEGGWSGIDHLEDYLGEIVAENDAHGNWRLANADD